MTDPTPSLWALVDARDMSIAALARVRAAEHETLVEKEKELQAMGAQLAGKEAELESLGVELAERQAQIEGKEAGLLARGAQLEEKEAALLTLTAQMREKEAALLTLTAQMKEKESQLKRMGAQLKDKENLVLKLGRDLEAKETALQAENKALQNSERERAFLQRMHDEGTRVTRGTGAEGFIDIHARLLKDLEDKEKVVRELRGAVTAYRVAFAMFGWFVRPMNAIISRTVTAFAGMTPKLGVLNQHPPRRLSAPPPYWLKTAPDVAPRIALITPSYQQGHFIERTIRSVLEQGYPKLGYHVQDGASSDSTREVLQRYEDKLTWASERDSGQTQAINRGFAHVRGDIMAWLNSDDILLPGALAYVADFFASHPDVDVIYGHRLLIDENDQEIGRWMVPAHNDRVLSWADYVPQETLFWRSALWEKVGGVDESFRFAMDWDLLVRFRDAGARFVRVPRFLGGFRIHPQQKTSAAISDIGFQEMTRIRERVLGRVPTHREVGKAVLPYLVRHMAVDLQWRIRNALGART